MKRAIETEAGTGSSGGKEGRLKIVIQSFVGLAIAVSGSGGEFIYFQF